METALLEARGACCVLKRIENQKDGLHASISKLEDNEGI